MTVVEPEGMVTKIAAGILNSKNDRHDDENNHHGGNGKDKNKENNIQEATWLLNSQQRQLQQLQQRKQNNDEKVDVFTTSSLRSLFQDPSSSSIPEEYLPLSTPGQPGIGRYHTLPSLNTQQQEGTSGDTCNVSSFNCFSSCTVSTFVGSLVFLIYHVVFCLAQAATIGTSIPQGGAEGGTTNESTRAMLTAVATKVSALGVIFAGPLLIYELGFGIPALYPASDLFLAPFLAQIAKHVHSMVLLTRTDYDEEYEQILFINTFIMVTSIAFIVAGILCILAARFKLANIGLFLPYSVLCGFFTTIGVLMWTLAFSVDTNRTIQDVIYQVAVDGNLQVLAKALLHHIPSVCIGIVMHIAGKKHPFWVVFCIFATVFGSYILLYLTKTTLVEATANHWFYSVNDFVATATSKTTTTLHQHIDEESVVGNNNLSATATSNASHYGPPMPFGLWLSVMRGDVHWHAVIASLPQILSLAILYLLRCSLHSAAVKKNIPNVTRKPQYRRENNSTSKNNPSNASSMSTSIRSYADNSHGKAEKGKQTKLKEIRTLNYILEHGYGYCHIVSAIVGGISIAPSVGASTTLFQLGAEGVAPQYGSCLLMLLFYVTDFRFVQYIPKPAFSCLMILASIDMCKTWLIESYLKTKDRIEWVVVPLLVAMAFAVGMLPAIVVGICVSTFIFAANFYNAGTVKFVGTGLTLRSTIERGVTESSWLDLNADLIQILVLQNYIFFGNIQSVSLYITTMFDDDDDICDNDGKCTTSTVHEQYPTGTPEYVLPPKPKYIIVDFTMVVGMDTSAIDLFRTDIMDLCKLHQCSLFLTGLNSNLRSVFFYAGIKPSGHTASSGRVIFFSDLEAALGVAEDGLISSDFSVAEREEYESVHRQRNRVEPNDDDGFAYTLQKIDEQHGSHTMSNLIDLRQYTQPFDLPAGEILSLDGLHSGIYFVESGVLHVQLTPSLGVTNNRSALRIPQQNDNTITRHSDAANLDGMQFPTSTSSIGQLRARTITIGRQAAKWKMEHLQQYRHPAEPSRQAVRLARIGQGWVIGSIECEGYRLGDHIAITNCRLHYLSNPALKILELQNPLLALHLYKLLSMLATKRQEATIHQLTQFVKIMSNPVPRLRGGKKELAMISLQHI